MAEFAPPQENTQPLSTEEIQALESLQQCVLWLSTQIIHHANNVRPNREKSKIGGHQASSASVVSIMTALYFHFLKAGDRVAVKPHASPVFHAIQYLLGQLPQEYLTQLRSYGGLQAYPSRTKDPDQVDFSTGSVGLGAVAPAFAALAHTYATHHFAAVAPRRFVALLGDAELDEGNVWEAILDPNLASARNLLWIVDLNRQSLDRVVPGIRAAQLKRLFAECGWRVVEVKYGHLLQHLFKQPGGTDLRRCIDEMNNEDYQALITLPGAEGRQRLGELAEANRTGVLSVVAAVPDAELPSILSNLGGHDLQALTQALDFVGQDLTRPTILFAYTIKGWGLPIAGDPLNHSKLLSSEQMAALQLALDVPPGQEWSPLSPISPGGALCQAAQQRLFPVEHPIATAALERYDIPDEFGIRSQGLISTQQALGQLLMAISRVPELSHRVVTISPDVSTSTNLSGWIIKNGVFKLDGRVQTETDEQPLTSWKERPTGQHIELGISEMNLFMALGMFGLAHEHCDQQMIPIGTVYDPFICRGLDSLIYALYSGAKFIFAGTPSGISLAPEGGAHQSTVTPSLGIELPNLNAYEPCFVKEMEWMMIEALRQCCDRDHGRATYFRLTTKQVDQSRMEEAVARIGEANLRKQVLAGGYRIVDWRTAAPSLPRSHLVHLVAAGAMVPDAMDAAAHLHQQGIPANVLNLTSAQRLYEAWRDEERHGDGDSRQHDSPFAWLLPPSERHAPIITVLDGASHALAWLGSVYGMRTYPLGVDGFGQSGERADLYRHFDIHAESIVNTARRVLVRSGIAL
ncbi:MAG: pyruvate dehydrogenase [Caldilineaceae bacterium]|nr:pyruvate dehydrogenase [Caldilineaceae bacterium]